MKKFTRNESGYALLLSFCVLLIFSILGLSLMTLTANGVSKNSNREDIILAQDLSDKGIDFVVGDIQKILDKEIVKTPMGKTIFGTLLDTTLNDPALKCPAEGQAFPDTVGIKIPGENSNHTKVCIDSVNYIGGSLATTEEKDLYKRIVTFKSIGIVDSKKHTLKTDVIIGTDAIPDQLRYAISSNENGSIFLYGGVDIKGDIKTAGDLVIHNQGYSLSGTTPNWRNSVYPRIKADSKSVSPKIIIPETGNLYINKSTSHLNTESKILNLQISSSNNNYYNKYSPKNSATQAQVRSSFFDSNNISIVTKSLDSDSVNITDRIDSIYYDNKYKTFYKKSGSDSTALSITSTNKNNVNLAKNDVVLIGGITKENTTCKSKDKKGNCTDWNTKDVFSTGNFQINANSVNLRGQYFVNGNLTIENSSINSDAIIYVNGDVDISNSTLSGLDTDGTLIIFATGRIKIIDISKYSDSPSKIKAFFYTKDTLNMFGVLSNIQIQGGISAKNVVLSSLRGKYTSNGSIDSAPIQSQTYDHDSNPQTPNIPVKNSRLSIIYDENLISQFTSFKRDEEEEFITELNDPEVIKRY